MDELNNIRDAILILGKKIDEQNARLEKLENASGIKHEIKKEVSENNFSSVRNEINHSSSIKDDNQSEKIQEKAETEDISVKNLEESIGAKWFPIIGIAALFLGISFFIKYAFDNNWISPVGRVAIGIIAGIILLGIGEKLIKKYSKYAQILSGGGIAVLYLSIYAAMNFYGLIDQTPTFILMVLITGIGIFLSLRYEALSLMVVATVGGFLTPFLASNGENNAIALFSYILILNLAILCIAFLRKWRAITVIGFISTIFVFITWAETFYTRDQLGLTFTFLTLYFFVYSLAAVIYNIIKEEKSTGIEQSLTLITAIIYFSTSYGLLNDDYHFLMGLFALVIALYYLVWAYGIRNITPEDKNLYNFLAFLGLGFITIAIPIQFEGQVITISWGIEAALLFYLGLKTKKDITKTFAIIVFAIAVFNLFGNSSYKFEYANVFNKIFFSFLFFIALSYGLMAMFKLAKKNSENNTGTFRADHMMTLFLIVANLLTIVVVSQEITFYYDKQINQIRKSEIVTSKKNAPAYRNSVSSYSKINKTNNLKIERIQNKKSVSLSIFWIIYGIILMVIGIVMRNKAIRVGGLAILILAILKLFFYDLWNLGSLYRIISSISLGIVLLLISFAYQKYKDRLKEII